MEIEKIRKVNNLCYNFYFVLWILISKNGEFGFLFTNFFAMGSFISYPFKVKTVIFGTFPTSLKQKNFCARTMLHVKDDHLPLLIELLNKLKDRNKEQSVFIIVDEEHFKTSASKLVIYWKSNIRKVQKLSERMIWYLKMILPLCWVKHSLLLEISLSMILNLRIPW